MEQYRIILRRVGLALVVVGLIDMGVMIYCIVKEMNYSSSLNIFAVIAGVFLIRGSLRAARIVTMAAAFFLSAFLGVLFILAPAMQPADLWVTEFRLNPMENVLAGLAACAIIALFAWVYAQLRSSAIVAARAQAGQATAPPKAAFALGALLVVFLVAVMHFMMTGNSAAKAVDLAKQQLGPSFKYHVTDISWIGQHGRATVKAYNRNDVKRLEVKW
jgi:uncharacterized OsmC-like protein